MNQGTRWVRFMQKTRSKIWSSCPCNIKLYICNNSPCVKAGPDLLTKLYLTFYVTWPFQKASTSRSMMTALYGMTKSSLYVLLHMYVLVRTHAVGTPNSIRRILLQDQIFSTWLLTWANCRIISYRSSHSMSYLHDLQSDELHTSSSITRYLSFSPMNYLSSLWVTLSSGL
jgi:hypothetical protein